jgi:acetyltransferase-like isoleucine patch superfamily enzyme
MMQALAGLWRGLVRRLEMLKYDDFSIAQYFRRQGALVGEGCRLQIRSLGSEPWLIRIGNRCTLSTDVVLVTHDGAASIFSDEDPSIQRFGPVIIGNNCFIGARAMVLPGVSIGDDCIVGAGSVVTKAVASGSVVAGVPARFICTTREFRERTLAAWAKQKPPGYMREFVAGHRYTHAQLNEGKTAYAALLRRHLTAHFLLDVPGERAAE